MGSRDQLVHLLECHVSTHNPMNIVMTSVSRYVVMIAMVFHAFNNALSAYGTYSQSRAILVTSLVIRVITWFITLAGMVVICIYGVEESTILIKELDVVFRDIIQRIDSDPRANRILVQIQEYVGCCGASGNSLDFVAVRKPMPDSCRHPVTGNRYGYHCPQVLAWWLEPWTSTLAGNYTMSSGHDR